MTITPEEMREMADSLDEVKEWEAPISRAAAMLRSIAAEREAVPDLIDALQWMVDNDETNEGDEPIDDKGGSTWNEINSYWIDGKNRALAAIAKAKGAE